MSCMSIDTFGSIKGGVECFDRSPVLTAYWVFVIALLIVRLPLLIFLIQSSFLTLGTFSQKKSTML